MKARIHIFPEIGDAFDVEIIVPDGVEDVEEFIDNWVSDNLNFVESYKTIF